MPPPIITQTVQIQQNPADRISYLIKIISYDGPEGAYSYYSYDNKVYDSPDEAIATAEQTARSTGKCYGVFKCGQGSSSKIHDTSPYYAKLNLKEMP